MTFAAFEWLGEGNNLRFILEGFLINLEIAVVAIVISLIVGLGLALARLSTNRIASVAAGVWVDLFRNLPLLLLILFLFLWIPQSARNTWEDLMPGWMPEAWQSGLMLAGLSGLVLYNSAVLAEIMRAGIQSLPRGQREPGDQRQDDRDRRDLEVDQEALEDEAQVVARAQPLEHARERHRRTA